MVERRYTFKRGGGRHKVNKKVVCLFILSFFLLSTSHGEALQKEERLWQDETVYYLMVDRFYNGSSENNYNVDVQDLNAYHGGDFKGIIDKLDYLKDLGFTTIVLSPIFDNGSQDYQGSRTLDFYKTEAHFGSIEELKSLVKEAHEKDMKILLEFVVDTVSSEHSWAQDETKNDWFTEDDQVLHLNLANREVTEYLVEVAQWWMKETEIDGYYFENVKETDASFWKTFNAAIKKQNETFFLAGKVSDGEWQQLEEVGFDSILDVTTMEPLRRSFSKQDHEIEESVQQTEERYSTSQYPARLGYFIDDKNSARFTYEIDPNKDNPGTRWKLAFSYLYTTPGIPYILYGSEIALNGGAVPENHQLLGFKADQELIDHLKLLGDLRQQLPALTRGNFEILYEDAQTVLFKRQYESETIIVAVNNSSKTKYITLSDDLLKEDGELRGLLAGDLVRENEGEYSFVIPREHSEIYALTDKTGINMGYIVAIMGVWVVFAIFVLLVMKRSGKRNKRE